MDKQQTTRLHVSLTEEDRTLLLDLKQVVRLRFGIHSNTDVVRMALRSLAEQVRLKELKA